MIDLEQEELVEQSIAYLLSLNTDLGVELALKLHKAFEFPQLPMIHRNEEIWWPSMRKLSAGEKRAFSIYSST